MIDIFSHKTLSPSKKEWVENQIKDIVKIYNFGDLGDNLAYVRRNKEIGDLYNINIDNTYNPAIEGLKLHENGHICFSHFRNQEQKREAIINATKINWEKIKHHFDKSISCEKAAIYLSGELDNILMDFEVNSKLFTEEEFNTYMYIIDDLLITKAVSGMSSNNENQSVQSKFNYTLYKSLKEKSIDNHLCKLCWPADYDMPLGLTYEAYLILALKNLDKFINDMKNNMSQIDQSKLIGSSESDGDSNDSNDTSNDGSEEGKGSGSKSNNDNKKIGSQIIKNSKDTVTEITDKGSEFDNSPEQEKKEISNILESDYAKNDGNHYRSNTVNNKIAKVHIGNNNGDIETFIKRRIFKKEKTQVIRNQLYNYNRQKVINSNVLIPKDIQITRTVFSKVFIIIDVSGSVNTEFVESCVKSISNVNGMYDKSKSRIISWSTHLCGDELLKTNKIYYNGGGTDIGDSINYVQKYVSNKEDKIFIISDFEDDLDKWNRNLNKLNCKKFAICRSNIMTKDILQDVRFDEILLLPEN